MIRHLPPDLVPTAEQVAIQASKAPAILVRANAGAAKTTTLALIVAQALHDGTPPEDILVLAYTQPACDAMRAALAKVGADAAAAKRVAVRTFDDFAGEVLLSVERERVPSKPTQEDIAPTVRAAMDALDLPADSAAIEQFLGIARRLKGTLACDEAAWQGLPVDDDLALDLGIEAGQLRLFTTCERLRDPQREGVDRPRFRAPFDATYDLARLLADPDSPTPVDEMPGWPRHLRWLLVDEMHDLNRAMFEIVRTLLSAPGLRFAGVGDVDQVVHANAGAEQRFMSPEVELGGRPVQVLPLTATHRFGPALAALAGKVADKPYAVTAGRATVVRRVDYPGPGNAGCDALVVEALKQLAGEGLALANCAVLLRHAWQSVAIENALLRADIAYSTRGFTRYVMQPEVLLIRGLLAVATGDFKSLASTTTRAELVRALVFFCGVELGFEVAEGESREARLKVAIDAVVRDAETLRPFIEYQVLDRAAPRRAARMRRAIDIAARSMQSPEPGWFDRFIDALDVGDWVGDVFIERQRRDDALHYFEGLKRAAATAASPSAFFESLGTDETRLKASASGLKTASRSAVARKKTVVLALVAEVKGLEFDWVLMPYLEQGLFPAALAAQRSEERNLFYVGITRAKRGLTLFASAVRPSEFVASI